MFGLFNKKKLSTKKYLEDNDPLIYLQMSAYFGWHVYQYKGEKIVFSVEDSCHKGEQDMHFELNIKELKEFVNFTKKLRSKVKVFLIKENRYRTIEEEIRQIFTDFEDKKSNVCVL